MRHAASRVRNLVITGLLALSTSASAGNVPPELIARASSGEEIRVIVSFDVPFTPVGELTTRARSRQEGRFAAAQQALADHLAGTNHREVARWRSIPAMALAAGLDALLSIDSAPGIESVIEDVPEPPALASSLPVIEATNLHGGGTTGAGFAVAILDTGVERTHSFFQSRVVNEACFAQGEPFGDGDCPNGNTSQTGTNSAAPCGIGGCDHGTHVAGIAAGANGPASAPSGAAPGANIMAIQVFSRFDESSACSPNPPPCALTYVADQISGLEHVLNNGPGMNVVSANMSLGGGTPGGNCDGAQSARKNAMDNLKSMNIATVVAAGNNGSTTGVSSPGCISTAITVSSTTDADGVSSFSNVGEMTDVFAPGSNIDSSVTGNTFGNKNGTSMAAPHVAGVWALLRQVNPSATVDQIETALESTGVPVADINFTRPRIRAQQAANALGGGGDSIGLFDPANAAWFEKNTLSNGPADNTFFFGAGGSGFLPVPGDWDGNGTDTPGLYNPANGSFFLKNSNGPGPADATFFFGPGGGNILPIIGDWNGDGFDSVGIYDKNTGAFFLKNSNASGPAEATFFFGPGGGDILPVVGDWNGDNFDSIGIYATGSGAFFIKNSNSSGPAEATFFFGSGGSSLPLTGDWNDDGFDSVGIFAPAGSAFFLTDSNASGPANHSFFFGPSGSGWTPMTGNWDGN